MIGKPDSPNVELVIAPTLLPGLSATGLDLPAGLPFEHWQRIGAALGALVRVTPWAIGDWLNFGERVYGETYAQAMDVTGLAYKTLANAKYVAGRIESSRRREHLAWSLHQEVASVPVEERDRWLDQAEAGDGDQPWSRARLRAAMARARPRQPWNLTDALVRLDQVVDAILRDAPAGHAARSALGRALMARGERLLVDTDSDSTVTVEEQGR